MRKVAIVGPGAMGSLFSYLLLPVVEELWVVDYKAERAEHLNKNGFKLETEEGIKEFKVSVSVDAQEIGYADLVAIMVKSYSTESAIREALPLIGKDSIVLSLQNGLGNVEVISEVVEKEKILGGTTAQGANLKETGYVRYAGKGETVIGALSSGKEKLEKVAELLRKAGLEVRVTDDLEGLLWSKVLINVGINALTAILRLKNGKLLNYQFSRDLMRNAVLEAEKVARAKGIKLVYEDSVAKVEEVAKRTAENISSMLQDVRAKKRTEVDYINGAVVREGEKLGIDVPLNRALWMMVKAIEASYSEALDK